MHQVLDGQSYTLFHLGRRCARHGGSDVQHRNENLGFFFAGGIPTAKIPMASDAAMKSTVSLELMNAFGNRPAIPRSRVMAGPLYWPQYAYRRDPGPKVRQRVFHR